MQKLPSEQWAIKQRQTQIEQEIFEYANAHTGITDLDQELEAASIECLLSEEKTDIRT